MKEPPSQQMPSRETPGTQSDTGVFSVLAVPTRKSTSEDPPVSHPQCDEDHYNRKPAQAAWCLNTIGTQGLLKVSTLTLLL